MWVRKFIEDITFSFNCMLRLNESYYMFLFAAIPTFAAMPVDTTVPIGDTAQLRCDPGLSSGLRVDVKWYMNGEPIERNLDGIRKRLAGNVSST